MEDNDNKPVCGMVADRGIRTSRDFTDFMGALMADLIAGRVDAKTANAACVAGGHMLKMTKMQMDYVGNAEESIALPGSTRSLSGGKSSNGSSNEI